MSKTGEFIRNKREEAGLTLEDISSKTAIRMYILQALENGDFNNLPSYVHAHGFLEQYCKAVGINFPNDVKPLFDEECKKDFFGKSPEEVVIEKEVEPKTPGIPSKVKIILLFLIVMVAVAVFAVINMNKSTEDRSPKPIQLQPQQPQIQQQSQTQTQQIPLQPKPVMEDNSTVLEPEPVVEEPIVPVIEYKARVEFNGECWTMIHIDDEPPAEFTAKEGTIRYITFKKQFRLDFGNAAAAKVVYKNQIFENFGREGTAMRNNLFTISDDGKLKYARVRNRAVQTSAQ